MAEDYGFVSEARFTAMEKVRLYRKFEKVVKRRDSSLIDKSLYTFLHVFCGYIAHYNLHGYRQHYEHPQGMLEMLEELLGHHFEWGAAICVDIGNRMKELAREELPKIRVDCLRLQEEKEQKQLRQLALKHGYSVTAKEGSLLHGAHEREVQLVMLPANKGSEKKRKSQSLHQEQMMFQFGV